MPSIGLAVVVAALAMAAGACTIDVGDVGAVPDAAAGAPSPDYFVSDVWPRYLDATHCADRGCHDFSDGHGTLRFRPPEVAPAPGTPLAAWPTGWPENYLSTIQQLRCDAPSASRLLTFPE